MSHTAGPWRIDPGTSPAAGRAIEAQAFDRSWKYVVDRVRGGSPEQAEFNARLIAAAPDLLAALKHVGREGHRFGSVQAVNCAECRIAIAAIAKAEGKEPT